MYVSASVAHGLRSKTSCLYLYLLSYVLNLYVSTWVMSGLYFYPTVTFLIKLKVVMFLSDWVWYGFYMCKVI